MRDDNNDHDDHGALTFTYNDCGKLISKSLETKNWCNVFKETMAMYIYVPGVILSCHNHFEKDFHVIRIRPRCFI